MIGINKTEMTPEKIFLALIGKNIKEQRGVENMSQQELAGKVDMEKSNMSRLESGKSNPTILTLKKVVVALRTTLARLTGI